jgi:hypothetical protein
MTNAYSKTSSKEFAIRTLWICSQQIDPDLIIEQIYKQDVSRLRHLFNCQRIL